MMMVLVMTTGNESRNTAIPTGNDPTLERLEDQINWYDRKSVRQKKYFDI